ncbi:MULTISPECIES: Gfo/Idh/MocA family protein [unclassified Crossiella]|uniref:Gfo/Idh/MocA family protein n=1 Tax=unclassified Crossiella TaxID=2620835 RepID=UPI001FFE6D73|nr:MULTISPECIES: Gfo/Idh/MocA family oxidoreductase [unclassified Crossiella]MCK2244439.1 Gfo/Idh/MocA family oxidoreductase [Crossiella sp. S99.2]MCK2257733.1 Gfo/Idh/MocA family oxidoreductase [Crossiella sp. S99.1]
MDPLRLGVLGYAGIARRRVLPAVGRTPGIKIAAIASRDKDRAAAATAVFGGCPVHGYEELLARADVDAVYVPLPAALHAEWVAAALRAGKHVLAEKPLTTDAAGTAELLALAARSGLVLMENIMFVHHAQHAEALALLADGAIGQVQVFQSCFAIPPLPPGDIRYQSDLDGGALWDVGVYPLRAASLFLGGSLEVIGAFLTPGARGVDVAGAALLRAAGGVAAHLTFGFEHAYRSMYEVWGDEGRLSVEHAFTPPADHRPTLHLRRGPDVKEIVLEPDDQVANTIAAFVAAVRAGVSPAMESSLELARLLAEVRSRA